MQLLRHHKECVEIVLGNVDFSIVDEVETGLQVLEPDALEVEERVVVRVLVEDLPEERRAGGEDEFVSLELVGSTAESAVKQVFLFSNITKC